MIYLHHYPSSLFSEKVRLLLGHYGLDWNSVEIPPIMPRPLLMPLSGGYRRTPVLQIGANVYCDTKIIGRALARHVGDDALYQHGFNAHRVADWADSVLFRTTVTLNFRPEALGPMMATFDPEFAAAFAKDRAELAGDQPLATSTPAAAMAVLTHACSEFDASVAATGACLFGDAPSIADFAVFHNLWFLKNNPVNAPLLDPWPALLAWYDRMAAIGHGSATEATGEDALAAARAAEPTTHHLARPAHSTFEVGQAVTVAPVDYGCIPVAGTLVGESHDEVIIARESTETGALHVHFPQAGFEVAAA